MAHPNEEKITINLADEVCKMEQVVIGWKPADALPKQATVLIEPMGQDGDYLQRLQILFRKGTNPHELWRGRFARQDQVFEITHDFEILSDSPVDYNLKISAEQVR